MNAMSTVSVQGNRLELDGPLLHTGAQEINVLRTAKNTQPEIVQIRFFNIDFANLDREFLTALEDLLTSRTWDRTILAYCFGSLSGRAIQGILQSTRLELYGHNTNALRAIGEALGRDDGPLEILRLRTRFQHDTILPLAEGLKTSKGLKQLYLTCEFTDPDSVVRLAAGLHENQHLEMLSLYSCEIFDEPSMETLITSLQNHPTLSTLELRNNNCFGMPALLVGPGASHEAVTKFGSVSPAPYHSALASSSIERRKFFDRIARKQIPQIAQSDVQWSSCGFGTLVSHGVTCEYDVGIDQFTRKPHSG
jgi:hypothetical protein